MKTSCIIHYRYDCPDRWFNLKTILSYINEYFYEIIIINDDKEVDPTMKIVKELYPNVKLLFLQNEGEFKKSHSFNEAVKVSIGDIFCFYDVDVIIPKIQLSEAIDMIQNKIADHVYPFNGSFVDVKKPYFDEFFKDSTFENSNRQLKDQILGFYNEKLHIISDKSPGGCNLISREAFIRMGGYNSAFIGWGFEDTEYRERSVKVNKVSYLNGEKYLFHLEHSSHCDQDRSKQPHYSDNYKIFLNTIK